MKELKVKCLIIKFSCGRYYLLRLIYCTSGNATPMVVIFYMITDVLLGGLPQSTLEVTTVTMFHAYSRIGTSGENISGNMIYVEQLKFGTSSINLDHPHCK